ncbi:MULTISPECIES: ribonuclease R [unclassified Psychrobacter]|uniref:ribonuclease R n=1 Tax=unclassified Psychrobacter TaxID=196806 RepID=UPI00078C8E73|nr:MULTISPECIES: ribonuclease R [unclassified Psychrobacter]AMN50709.1 ribonuclease R [Psychrobacter sp. P2G3]AMN68609.1 ribonuclease R [Psychrobacter sp. P11G5]
MSWNDPNASSEAQKYDNPIPSRELILHTIAEHGEATHQQLAKAFDINDPDQFDALGNRLKAMARDGQVNREGRPYRFRTVTQQDVVTGTVSAHPKGFGFVVLADMPDLFLHEKQMRWVFNGDTVNAIGTSTDNRGRTEGRIVDVTERHQNHFIGTLARDEDGYCVELGSPNNHQPITVTEDNIQELGAKKGDPVKVDVIDWPNQHEFATGKITEVLSDDNDRELIIETTLLNYDIPSEFSEAALKQANDYREPSKKDLKGRTDLRDLPLVTIDGEDARDFDDAVFAEKRSGGNYRVLVAIADVSHYVTPNSPLDQDAYERGTSVYFPHRVIPMLPEVLSNGLCSLNPSVDRLCMVADIKISRAGKVTGYEFYPGVMHSQARLTYNQVNDYFANPKDDSIPKSLTDNKDVKKSVDTLHQLYDLLIKKREERHAMEFETVETYIKFNEKGGIAAILPRTRGDAHKLIEECMLLANTCAANFALKNELPVLYRNHDKPDGEKSMRVHEYAKNFGLSFPEESPTQADYQRIIEATKDRPDAVSIHSMLLRSMMQANYAPDNIGHFGLAYDEYSHFTSPIRRYPDLMLHRAIKAKVTNSQHPVMDFSLDGAGTQTSDTERRAEKASRFVESWLKCHYMKDHVGEEFDGVVTTVTSFGLFVTLTDLYIDGLVHISNVGDDFFVYDEQQQQLIGKDKGTLFGLGDLVKVKVAGVNMDLLQIDFDLKAKLQSSEMNQTKKGQPKRSSAKKSSSRNSKGASKKS